MDAQTRIACVLILAGAMTMLLSIKRAGGLTQAVSYIPEDRRKPISRFLAGHRGLMIFFFLGYLAVTAAFASGYRELSETFTGVIFFFGAIFVFIGIVVQSRLLAELQQTLRGCLPICAGCKKIRSRESDPEDPKAWKQIEAFLSEKSAVRFSHGYCPGCYQKELEKVEKIEGRK